MSDERMAVIVMGRKFGTASGWDLVGDHAVVFYDFETTTDTIRSGKDLCVDFETGMAQLEEDEKFDLVPILITLPLKV